LRGRPEPAWGTGVWRRLARGGAAAALGAALLPAQAGLFDDDEARKAILDLRAKVDQNAEAAVKAQQLAETRQAELQQRHTEQAAQQQALMQQMDALKRSLLDLNNQIELLRSDLAKMRGNDEQLARDVAELQRKQKDVAQGIDERLRRVEPQKVTLDGKEFMADPDEKAAFENALGVLRRGEFEAASGSLDTFLKRYPGSGFANSALYWLGNAQYGNRDYKEAISTFGRLVAKAPDHPRAPEALLAMANCQVELKDKRGARKTLEELIKSYPKSEAAQAGTDRLALLK
jgi:tol-pal system protein YbgF